MEVLAALVSSLLAEPCRRLFISVHSKVRNSLYFKSCFDDLNLEMKDLIKKRDAVKQDVEAADKLGLVPRAHVQDWLKEVNQIEAEVASVKERIQNSSRNCTHFRYFNSKYREDIRQVLQRQLVSSRGLKEAGNFPDGVAAPVRAEHIPGPSIEFQSTAARNIAQVMDLLSSDEVKRIGIWGMGGAGKTTLVSNVNNKLKSAALLKQPFSIVIWVTVSNKLEETSDLRRVQQQIADRLKMELPANEESTVRIAIQLHERLEKERFLLILDDLWHPIDLDTVGVPRHEICRGSKILLTTRFTEVCRAMMTDRIFKIELLNEQEAWLLFRESAGAVVASEHIEPLAKEITRECCGLPLAICVVGASMRGKNMVELWQDAVNTLRRSEPVNRGTESKVFAPLKFSYDILPDERIKSCFLYCCLYPEDHLIDVDELIWYWLAEGLIDDHWNLEQVRNRGIAMIECLKDHCLLEKGQKKATVKMHDIVRDVAIWIASSKKEGKSVIKPGIGLRRIANENIFESATRLSFMFNRIYILPESVAVCPLASTLLLQGNDSLELLPDKFLQAFLSIKVLDLSGSSIKSLPCSLCLLVELRALILAQCEKLEEIPPVGKLGKLQLLNCRSTNIKELPEGMERLTNLRELDLSMMRSSTIIRAGTIAALSNLETLRMIRCTGKWLTEGNEGEVPSLLEEILSLEQLIFCDIVLVSIPSKVSPGDPLLHQIKKLQRFTFYVGSIHFHIELFGDESRRNVILGGLHFSEEWIGWLFSNATSLQLIRCEGLNQMFQKITMHSSSVGSFEGLCKLDIAHSSSSFELTANWDMQFDLLPNLETLCFLDLSMITCISRLAEHLGLKFRKLKSMRIERCPQLKYLLSLGVSIPKLEQLKDISVNSCEELEELFRWDFPKWNQTFAPDAAFPNIQKTTLRNLPKLLGFSRQSVVVWPNMEKLEVTNCHMLRMIFGPIQNAKYTKEI